MNQKPRPHVTVTVTERTGRKPDWVPFQAPVTYRYKVTRFHWTDEHGVRHNELSPPPGFAAPWPPWRYTVAAVLTLAIIVVIVVVVLGALAASVPTPCNPGTLLNPNPIQPANCVPFAGP